MLHAASLAVATIGRALAQARGIDAKHGIKEVDRLLSNAKLDVWGLFAAWVPMVLAQREEAVVALDWTDFDKDSQATIALHLLTSHGRTTPLLWKTVKKEELAGRRNEHEDDVLQRFKDVLPAHVKKVVVLADRGFGDSKLYEALKEEWGFDFVIRFRGVVQVEDAHGEVRTAADWLPKDGRPKLTRGAKVTADKVPVTSVVCVKKPDMKEAWFLASSLALPASQLIQLYGRRFTIEETFRDTKDWRFGMGLSASRIGDPNRRDRLLLISALAAVLLTLLGAASEAVGLDKALKANTVKRRTHSLFFQGTYYYGALPNMKPEKLELLMRKFGELILQQQVFRDIYGLI